MVEPIMNNCVQQYYHVGFESPETIYIPMNTIYKDQITVC